MCFSVWACFYLQVFYLLKTLKGGVDTRSVPLACHHLIGLLSVDRSDVAHIDWSSSVDVPVMWHLVIGHESRSLRTLSQPNSVRLINLFFKTNSLCSLISVCISA